MMSGDSSEVESLIKEANLYDQHVDIVSLFEWIFTGVPEVAATVDHFDRFPRINPDGNGSVTPDFTVLFHDGTAIIGEISNLALHDNSAEKLCKQIGRYSELKKVPGPRGPVEVSGVDVLQLVPMDVGPDAVKRILQERMDNPDHPYKPTRRPCLAQFVRTSERYLIQHIPSPINGRLEEPVGRKPNIMPFLESNIKVEPSRFVAVKTRRVFINDPVPALYLATHLWTRTWPDMYGRSSGSRVIDSIETANILKLNYQTGRISEVNRALTMLETARLAVRQNRSEWKLTDTVLGNRGDRDIMRHIARRYITPPKKAIQPVRRMKDEQQLDLLDLIKVE